MKIDTAPIHPAAEIDPIFAASEAALLVPGDKNKLDTALQPNGDGSNLTGVLTSLAGHYVSELANNAGYLNDISSLTAGAAGVVTSLNGHNVSELANDAGYLINPMSPTAPGDMVYTMWSDSSPGAVMNARLPIGTPGQILSAVTGWQNGTGVFPGWIDAATITAFEPTDPTKWDSSPANLNDAVNRMAAAIATLLGTPIP